MLIHFSIIGQVLSGQQDVVGVLEDVVQGQQGPPLSPWSPSQRYIYSMYIPILFGFPPYAGSHLHDVLITQDINHP